ncbi:hypothetical protein C7212DRAFT_344929 [Tuber magnatum]|uniref:Cwf18 pre-mRNA splicing factor n=1 Tax=Tuber magnatum TaxID=42249 RepID=A0A317SLE2_9PEZI|nr:hypothetical protein C7212DRAFT_344929 [Tuber magnatum]
MPYASQNPTQVNKRQQKSAPRSSIQSSDTGAFALQTHTAPNNSERREEKASLIALWQFGNEKKAKQSGSSLFFTIVMSSITSLDAQSAARKERLAQLKSLKRKQPLTDPLPPQEVAMTTDDPETPEKDTNVHLSGRNYDIESRAPKMGFVSAPNEGQETLEDAAKKIVETTKALQMEDEKNDKPIDLFNLQPKKPNWDLKRDVDKKLGKLNQRTDIAIAKIIRARIEEARQKRIGQSAGGDGTEDVEGNVASMVHQREKERERDTNAEAADGDGADSP